jgi:hypothetical protein
MSFRSILLYHSSFHHSRVTAISLISCLTHSIHLFLVDLFLSIFHVHHSSSHRLILSPNQMSIPALTILFPFFGNWCYMYAFFYVLVPYYIHPCNSTHPCQDSHLHYMQVPSFLLFHGPTGDRSYYRLVHIFSLST